MKIAIIGADNFDSLEFHLKNELDFQGHETKIFDYKNNLSKKIEFGLTQLFLRYAEYKNKQLLSEILNYKPDLIIGVYRHIHPLLVKAVKAEKIKIIHINPDQLTTLQYQQLFVEPYNAYFSKDPYMVGFMKDKLNLNVFQYQEAFNPRIHKKPEKSFRQLEEEINIDLLCFGNLYPYRNRMLRILKENEIEIALYGRAAKYFDPYLKENFKKRGIYGEEKAHILNGAKIVFNNFHYAEIESVNNKFFEITGSGAFQICDYKPILKDLLPIDPRIISFKTIDEAAERIRYFLNNPEERWDIRKILSQYFLEKYTYNHLVNFILSKI